MYLDHRPEKMREEDFKDPPARFRGTPFWAWNCEETDRVFQGNGDGRISHALPYRYEYGILK